MADSYSVLQAQRDEEYRSAWDHAPESFKRRAAAIGLQAELEAPENLGVMEYDENNSRVTDPGHTPSFYTPDMALTLDTHVDQLVEKYRGQVSEAHVRAISADLEIPMAREIEKNRALMLGRVVLYLVKSPANTILARVHQLIHAIPGVAIMVGFGSMRESAKACGVSCEWVRRGRDKWCATLEIPIPAEGRKSEEAKQRYRENGLANHWRHQTVKLKSHPKPSPSCLPKLKPIPIQQQLVPA